MQRPKSQVRDVKATLLAVKRRKPSEAPQVCFLRGTFAPARRACDKPIAIACLRLLTVLPERPLFSLPRFISCIARWTFLPLARPYLRAMIVSPRFSDVPVPYLLDEVDA